MKSKLSKILAFLSSGLSFNKVQTMDIQEILSRARIYEEQLTRQKLLLAPKNFAWYPYGTLQNFIHLNNLLTGANRNLRELIGNGPVADIGAADGDIAFFIESLGLNAEIIDHSPTNFNSLRGARLLKDNLKSAVEISDIDLDSYFTFPQKRYGLVFFLGILYHLKNPFYVLETLARITRFCFISTRTTQYLADKETNVSAQSIAYFLGPEESNNDPTNYWVFSDIGLRRILARTGWEIADCLIVGNLRNSDPATAEGDQRTFLLVKSKVLS